MASSIKAPLWGRNESVSLFHQRPAVYLIGNGLVVGHIVPTTLLSNPVIFTPSNCFLCIGMSWRIGVHLVMAMLARARKGGGVVTGSCPSHHPENTSI